MKRFLVAMILFVTVPTVAFMIGLGLFAKSLPLTPLQPDATTDAIVVWTGGAERVSTGLDLLAAGRAKKLFVSGVGPDTTLDSLLRVSRPQSVDLRCCIVLGREAIDTIGNAAETATWMRGEQYTSMRLVTAAYHMPRALLLLENNLPGSVVVPHPIVPAGFDPVNWWSSRESRNVLAGEYVKYLLARVRRTAFG
ncbi:YdcF family protein [Roseiterribacter gracilis]|uniref:DUF218 domain-containing protein n=1 Tax=Roseiterribacter gracilis TaxID=2812848 RepID=A0A8S8X706_9PROT|nr:hypothetical protein TMPK1_10500 [Rhodospirillales bacterium TMPK1]